MFNGFNIIVLRENDHIIVFFSSAFWGMVNEPVNAQTLVFY